MQSHLLRSPYMKVSSWAGLSGRPSIPEFALGIRSLVRMAFRELFVLIGVFLGRQRCRVLDGCPNGTLSSHAGPPVQLFSYSCAGAARFSGYVFLLVFYLPRHAVAPLLAARRCILALRVEPPWHFFYSCSGAWRLSGNICSYCCFLLQAARLRP